MGYTKVNARRKVIFLGVSLVAISFVLAVNGALPFLTSPTLGQAVWTSGFSQSFLNEGLSTIYSHNIGIPEPAAIAFGLAGAFVTAVFMAVGLHAADAYSAMIAFWLIVAFLSAFKLARFVLVPPNLAVLSALAWCTMPMVWNHAGYSMVSTGIALLPLYLLAALWLFSRTHTVESLACSDFLKLFLFYLAVCLLAVFMDGYTFMMFASGASIIAIWSFFNVTAPLKQYGYRLFIHILSFGLAYLLYALYLGKPQFEASPIDFFRGWGVDIAFWLIPSAGVHWIPDLLGLSNLRSDNQFFGDSSVWVTTFALPLIIGALTITFISKKTRLMLPLTLITLVGFYMALGPSFKFNSVKPAEYTDGPLMEAQYAVAPTGTAVLSKHLPGFKNMRASYRWQALGVLGAWALIVLAMSRGQRKSLIVLASVTLGFVIILNLPNLPNKFVRDINHRTMFFDIDDNLVADLKNEVFQGEKVLFLPWRNDFLVNYLAAKLDIRTYNIGGDKNLMEARRHWPGLLQQFQMAKIDQDFAERVSLVLARKEADVVILPYIDMLWAAHAWPAKLEYKEALESVEQELRLYDWLAVESSTYYSVIRLKNDTGNLDSAIAQLIDENCSLVNLCVEANEFNADITATQVGIFENGILKSSHQRGFLLYGPYRPLEAGEYLLQIHGRIDKPAQGWIDVVSNRGKVVHAKFPLNELTETKGSQLLSKEIIIDEPLYDVEVRVFVTEADSVSIESYALRKNK